MRRDSEEFILFVNRQGEGVVIEGDYEWEYQDFEVRDTTTINEDLLEVDGFGVTCRVDVKKAFKPLKFYRIKWWLEEMNTQDGCSETSILESFEEIDYINEQVPKMLDLQKMKFMR